MKNMRLLILGYVMTFFLCLVGFSQSNEDMDSDEYGEDVRYVFLSGQVNAQVKGAFEPVARFDGKKLHFHEIDAKIKPKKGLPCSVVPEVVVSNIYAEVVNLEYDFFSRAALRATNEAVSDMMYTQTVNSIGNDFERLELKAELAEAEANFDGFDTTEIDRISQDIERLVSSEVDFNEKISEHVSSIDGEEYESATKDTIQGNCEIVSVEDVENAYCVLTLSFDESNADLRMKGVRRSIARVVPIGFVQEGVPNTLKFKCEFSEYEISNAKVELLLFSGDGTPIANNYSPALKKMTADQFERYMKLEGAVDHSVIR